MTAYACRSVRIAMRPCEPQVLMTGRVTAHGGITLLFALDLE